MQWLIKYRWFTLLIAIASIPILWSGIEKAVQVDNRLSIWFLEDDLQLQDYYEFQDKFGNDELLFILVKSPTHALKDKFLTQISKLTDSLEKLPRIERVLSPTNLKIPDGLTFGISRFSNLQNAKFSLEERKELLKNFPSVASVFFNSDYTASALIIQPSKYENYEAERTDFIAEVKATSLYYFNNDSIHFAGIGVIYDALNQLSEKEFALYLGIAYMVIFLMIGFIYRQISILIYVFLVIILANCFTLGIYGFAGLQLNLMSSLIPIIISLLGVLDIVHIVNQHQKRFLIADKSGLSAMKWAFKPCLFTSLTTMAGFLTLYVSPMPILRNFGLFAAIGIFFCLVFSFLLAPIFIPYLKNQKPSLLFEWLIPSIQFFSNTKQKIILAITSIIILISLFGLIQIETNSDTLSYFPNDHQVRQDSKYIEQYYGAYLPIEYLINSKENKEQELLENTIEWTKSVSQEVKSFEKNIGFHTLYENSFKLEYNEKWKVALKSKGLIKSAQEQIKKNYPDLYQNFTHEESKTHRVTFYTKMLSANEMTTEIAKINDLAKQHFNDDIKVSPAGYQPMYATIISFVIKTQVYSLILAFTLLLFLLWIITKNLKIALLSTFINLLPVAVIFGVMGWFNINLDTATASLAAIILCICIDDTIHFIHHFLQHKKLNKSTESALNMTLQSVGIAILISSSLLFFGFALMIFASLKTVFYFGLLISIAVLTAYLSQIYLFPVLLLRLIKNEK
jgi:predicted RND superfamily exporter protein